MLRIISAMWVLSLLTCSVATAQPRSGFTAHFTGCSEFVGWGPVNLTAAAPLVPHAYVIAGAAAGTAAIVVRATQCATVQVPGTPALPTTLSQIGINLVSPDGTGDINNYTLLYVSNNPYLVRGLQQAGVPAQFDPDIRYEYTLNPAGTGGELYAAVPNGGVPAYFFYGSETEPPPNSQQLFLANWWFGERWESKQSTVFPKIAFGTAAVTFYTSRQSELGKLIGGNADGNFTILSVRGEYATADLTVTIAGR